MKHIDSRSTWQILAYSLISCSLCYANPSSPSVVQGTAQFDNIDASSLAITTSDKAVINWNDFSIAEGELTQFLQPSYKSVVVNKVTSDLSSVLLGSLKANGKIYLINPNGILVGKEASIDTSSFIASTLSVNPQDLLRENQDVLFQGSSTATITNLGSITAWDGDIYLIGYQVDNQGSVEAKNGTVAIGAGQEVLLKPTDLEKIVIRPSLAKYENSSSIYNSGSIAACRAELKADGNAYAMAINHTGSIDAIGISEQNGEVYLVSGNGNNGVYGTITAKSADGTGGSVQILGDHIALLDNALVDASGELGGGTVLIGGDKSGLNPAIWNARTTYVDINAVVLADAILDGNGGKVITWADEATCFYGTISARGGENSGDGGFVEISGRLWLDHKGAADRLAPHGKAGTLLLDPLDIVINNSTTMNVTSPSAFIFEPNGSPSNLNWSDLLGAGGLLNGDTIVQTAAGGASVGNIEVADAPSGTYNTAFNLTLDNTANATTGDITFDSPANLFNNGSGGLIVNSKNNISFIGGAGFTSSGGGPITLTAGGSLSCFQSTLDDQGGPGNITLTAVGPILLNEVEILSDHVISISSNSDITSNNSSDIETFLTDPSINALVFNAGGSVSIDNTDIEVHNNSNALFVAGTNISITSGTNITSGGLMTFVVDNAFPAVGTEGPGQFTYDGTGNILATGVNIYTVQPSQNFVGGMINGGTYTPTTPYNNDATNQWLTWYPTDNTAHSPFIFFYKGMLPPPPPPPPHVVQTAVTLFNSAAYEFLQDIENYDVFWYWDTTFTAKYDPKLIQRYHLNQGFKSEQPFHNELYHVLRKSYKELNGKVLYILR